ncbi:MAG: DUF488 domain-containing protein, partial [Deltaproteobacteria bacterium]|nr:DUF488 domain-containing protein [Deltaproteobacteria bacterium]
MNARGSRRPRVFTLGHSDHTLEELMEILGRSSVRLVADVRSNPASARFPWFERSALATELERRGLFYRWFRDLGGRRPATPGEERHAALADPAMRRYAVAMNTAAFGESCAELLGLAASTVAVVFCAERDFKQCHRHLLADKLVHAGSRVV